MTRSRIVVVWTLALGLAALLLSAVVERELVNDLRTGATHRETWTQTMVILLVPIAFGSLSLLLPDRRANWWTLAAIAACAAFGLAATAAHEFNDHLDVYRGQKWANKFWFGVMYFGGGMLLPLAVTVGRLALRVRRRSARGVLP